MFSLNSKTDHPSDIESERTMKTTIFALFAAAAIVSSANAKGTDNTANVDWAKRNADISAQMNKEAEARAARRAEEAAEKKRVETERAKQKQAETPRRSANGGFRDERGVMHFSDGTDLEFSKKATR
jgi:hypothetical protein